MFGCIFICLQVNTIKLVFLGSVVRNNKISAKESLSKTSFNISTERSKNLLVEDKTISSAYKRSWMLEEVKEWQMDDIKMLKNKRLRQLPWGRPL